METVRSLIHNLIIIGVLAVFLEMLLPVGDMRRYLRMVMGFLIIIAVLQAMGNIVHCGFGREFLLPTVKENGDRLADIMTAGQALSARNREKALEQYCRGVAGQVMALTQLKEGVNVTDTEVEVDSNPNSDHFGQLKEIRLVVTGAEPQTGPVKPVTVGLGENQAVQMPEEEKREFSLQADVVATVAGFYGLSRDRVKIVYR
ncbi:MAG: hypothetical protein C4589_10320 [Peptococcaceae bacterium]|nr:MAG: hypothetical protein C4589_10320 [Peptococcaceae bacterium]